MNTTKLTAQEIAQAMLNRYGFFVVCRQSPSPLGVTPFETNNCAGTGKIPAGIVLVAPASEDDYRKQCELVGKPVTECGWYKYRAVAE